MKKIVRYAVAATLSIMNTVVQAGPLAGSGGTSATPSVYDVTVKKIEFKKGSTGTWVTYFQGTSVMSMGSDTTAANTAAGSVAGTAALENGTYTHIRITLDRDFDIKASATTNTVLCHTSSSATGTLKPTGSPVTLPQVSTGGTESTQSIKVIPSEIEASIGSSPRFELTSSELLINFPYNFTISNLTPLPDLAMDFDVGSSVEILYVGAGGGGPACVALVLPPQIYFKKPDGTEGEFKFGTGANSSYAY